MEYIFKYSWDIKLSTTTTTSKHVLFCLLFRHTDNDVFDDFPKISHQFATISGGDSEKCNLHVTATTTFFAPLSYWL